jgi:hypothetical protein
MNPIKKSVVAACIVGCVSFYAGSTQAAASPEQAARLGKDLTPTGAEQAANAAGTIPAWTGGITAPPSGYKAGMAHPDPFAGDKIEFTITPQNYKQHADKLTVGQQAMFAKYPTFKMNVYQTRRTASFPQRTYEMSKVNATKCQLVANGEGVQNCAEGLPFPIPQNAYEVIWNHKLKYKGVALARWSNQAAVTAGGSYNLVRLREELLGLYFKPGNTSENINNILAYFYQEVKGPARLAGQVLLVHDTLNQAKAARQAWVYNPGQRRVRRAPNVEFDNPGTASDGLRTNDMTDMFNGAMNRHEWKIVGKKEVFVPYNSYKAHSDKVKVKDLVRPNHLNPDLLRYELHRVWVVEATLKKGSRHINARRTFYVDEDSWSILVLDHYDGQGNIWRYMEAPSVNYYEVPVFWATLETSHDLKTGRYITGLLDNEESPFDFGYQATPEDFSPQNLRARGIR